LLDHWEREPWHLIAAGFLWGAVPATGLVIVSQETVIDLLSTTVFFRHWTEWEVAAVMAAPLVEELCKGVALLLLFVFFRQYVDTLMDGLVYGAAVGFGFAAVENIYYFRMAIFWGGPVELLVVALLRAFVFGLGHGYYTAMTGLGFALGRFSKTLFARISFPLLGLTLAMVVHGMHNFLCLRTGSSDTAHFWALGLNGFWILGAIALIVTSLLVQRMWIRRYLQEEVGRNVLTSEQALAASSIWRSWTACGVNRRFYQSCAKLALLDHTFQRVGERGQPSASIEALRKRVARLSRYLRIKSSN
jgi:RsiW-degrading membrane proteinase PrsW (M82 family)